ncbi:MAG TPA: hypothetical protein VHM91_07205 [Verrucomicrobiales bacterium]|nr:hypothetical protein [Verrucomicrobiales bacterium]
MQDGAEINLATPLRLKSAFRFPLQSPVARAEVIEGALWLLLPVVGWIMNMGHRIVMTHRMQHGMSPWPAWTDKRALLKHGSVTLLGMIEYHLPAAICGFIGWWRDIHWLLAVASVLWIAATVAVPGYMSHYCRAFDPREVFDPFRALRRVFQGGRAYWHAWSIALAALGCSFLGLLCFGVGFLLTSVWFWQVAGFSFATVFTRRFQLHAEQAGAF